MGRVGIGIGVGYGPASQGGPAYETPSYSNAGGTGDRTASITVTSDLTYTGPISHFVNGSFAHTVYWDPQTQAVAGKHITFGFAAPKLITEAKFYQDGNNSHGTWKWQGSNDNANWIDIGTSFVLGVTTTQVQTSLSGNTIGYKYYRLLGVSGNTNADGWPYITEFEFKIGNIVIAFNPLTDVASGTLVAWFESSFGTFQDSAKTILATANSDVVGAIADQSGNAHDFLQSTTGNKPLYKTNIAGSTPGILFDSIDDFLVTASFGSGINYDGYTLFISIITNDGVNLGMFARGAADPSFYSKGGGGVVMLYSSGVNAFNAVLDLDPHVLTFRRPDGGSTATRLYVDSILDTANPNADTQPWITDVLTLGNNGAGSQFFSGYVFAIGLFSGALSDADRIAVENYLLGKLD
jgi:hypothetical protein